MFTKFDIFVARLGKLSASDDKNNLKLAEQKFKESYGRVFEKLTKDVTGQIPYALVASTSYPKITSPHDITMQSPNLRLCTDLLRSQCAAWTFTT